MKTFAIREAANLLEYEVESVYELLVKNLTPYISFPKPIEFSIDHAGTINRFKNGEISPARFKEMDGVFEITGYSEIIWDEKNGYGGLAGVLLTKDGERCLIAKEKIQIKKSDVLITEKELLQFMDSEGIGYAGVMESEKTPTAISEASNVLKSHQTAEIDKKIDAVIQVIDDAIRTHLKAKKHERVVNHILFLKEHDLAECSRAIKRVKKHIKDEFTKYCEITPLSRRPGAKDGYFVTC
jgi:hypothetical protein